MQMYSWPLVKQRKDGRMGETLDRIIKTFESQLGEGWTVKPQQVFNCVHFFICEIEGKQFLTHSWGVYKEMDVEKVVSKEVTALKNQYALTLKGESDVRKSKRTIRT